jgi:hypothetical protein
MPGPIHLCLELLNCRLAICRLDPQEAVPLWAGASDFSSVTRTREELSIVCREADVPEGIRREGGWRIFKVEGPLDFALTGVLASLAGPLSEAGVSLFAVSTFDTDYVMVREDDMERAAETLRAAGHSVD